MSCFTAALAEATGALVAGAAAAGLGAGGGALAANSALAFSTSGCRIVIEVGFKYLKRNVLHFIFKNNITM